MITVGLDFGTHQTKVCLEHKEGVECEYEFFKFEDKNGIKQYTLPSIISRTKDGKLEYGYINENPDAQIIRYFKQGAFCTATDVNLSHDDAIYYSIWYIAYILFDLEEKYGQEFTIQMGAPADSEHIESVRRIAVSIIASAYRLVEEVFKNNKNEFLTTRYFTLKSKTEIVPYSSEIKATYGLLVFPEAYACLKPLTENGKISRGMSLMVDIGGGTTDISFFTIENNVPQVYDFFSINKGLNYLTGYVVNEKDRRTDSNVKSISEIDYRKKQIFSEEINKKCKSLVKSLQDELRKQTGLKVERLMDALQNRPIIYCGGGSTFRMLHYSYGGFRDIKLISHQEWDKKSVKDIKDVIDKGLCPILSTAYGLAISVTTDNIVRKPFRDIFDGIRGAQESGSIRKSSFGSALGGGFNYADDYDAWK